MDGSPLRISEPTPAERQMVMPFAEDTELLAVPLNDVRRWRTRTEAGRNRDIKIDSAWFGDDRYLDLMERCFDAGVPGSAVFINVAATAMVLVRNDAAVGLQGEETAFPKSVMRSWRWEKEDGVLWKLSVKLAIKSGVLVTVDRDDSHTISTYKPAKFAVRAPERPPRGAIDAPDRPHQRTAVGRESTSSILERDLITTTTGAKPVRTIRISPGSVISLDDPAAANEALAKVISDKRRELGLAVYPYTMSDFRELKLAVKDACATGRLSELVKVLQKATKKMNNGAGFKHMLQEAGFLPRRISL